MNKKTKIILLGTVVAGLGVAVYLYFKNRPAAAATAPAGTPAAGASTGTASPPASNIPDIVKNWILSTSDPQAWKDDIASGMLTQTDVDNLAKVIPYWNSGQTPPPDLTAWFSALAFKDQRI